jgi:lipopolysaccharide/colanic/teichoic acid biosynthesis glycosyltransferase
LLKVSQVSQERRATERRSQTLTVLHERRRRESATSVRQSLPTSQPTRRLALENLHAGLPFVAAEGNRTVRYIVAKRFSDIAGAAALLVLLSPIMLLVFAILTLTTFGRPIFAQQRLGFRGRPFRMFKFRSMRLDAEELRQFVVNEKDGPIFKNHQDPRITRFGRFLRASSIDELPQLFNVLKGDMSLVGPRPPIATEVADYEPWQRRRLAVRPGLTCLWQVSGRSEVGFEDWVRMDLWYIRNQTFATDVKLLLKTPYSVLTGRGAW